MPLDAAEEGLIESARSGNVGRIRVFLATIKGLASLVKEGEGRGPTIDAQNVDNDNTALHCAVGNGHEAAALLLIESGARVDLRNHHGFTPLMYAAAFSTTTVIGALCRAGANPAWRTRQHRTALMLAAYNLRAENVRFFLSILDVRAKRPNGKEALDDAIDFEHGFTVFDEDPNPQDQIKKSAEIVSDLLKAGAGIGRKVADLPAGFDATGAVVVGMTVTDQHTMGYQFIDHTMKGFKDALISYNELNEYLSDLDKQPATNESAKKELRLFITEHAPVVREFLSRQHEDSYDLRNLLIRFDMLWGGSLYARLLTLIAEPNLKSWIDKPPAGFIVPRNVAEWLEKRDAIKQAAYQSNALSPLIKRDLRITAGNFIQGSQEAILHGWIQELEALHRDLMNPRLLKTYKLRRSLFFSPFLFLGLMVFFVVSNPQEDRGTVSPVNLVGVLVSIFLLFASATCLPCYADSARGRRFFREATYSSLHLNTMKTTDSERVTALSDFLNEDLGDRENMNEFRGALAPLMENVDRRLISEVADVVNTLLEHFKQELVASSENEAHLEDANYPNISIFERTPASDSQHTLEGVVVDDGESADGSDADNSSDKGVNQPLLRGMNNGNGYGTSTSF